MNKFLKLLKFGAICATSLVVLAACGSDDVTVNKGDTVFTNRAYIDLSNMPAKLNIQMEAPEGAKGVEHIYIGTRVQIYDDKCAYKNGVLTINTKAFVDEKGTPKLNSGDRVARVKFKNVKQDVEITILFVDKVITTADELQRINENPSGSYILGNDIDCSEISNFEPIGFTTTATSSTINQEFLGVFDGNGYTIKNLTSRYATDLTSEKNAIKSGNYLFDNDSHKSGDQFGVFQNIGPTGVVRNTGFKNVHIYGRTISGVISGMTSGVIENCFVDKDCDVTISTHFYDEACNAGVLSGFVTPDGSVRNNISLGKAYVLDSFKAYSEDYIQPNIDENGMDPESPRDDLMTWSYWGSSKGSDKLDSNGVETNGIYAGVGMVHGEALDNYCLKFQVENSDFSAPANFGQTHIFENKEGDGPNAGAIVNCLMKTEDELKSATIYDGIFDNNSWNIYDGSIPTLRAFYSYTKAQ